MDNNDRALSKKINIITFNTIDANKMAWHLRLQKESL